MVRLIQFIILGICLGALAMMWLPSEWLDSLRHPSHRIGYTIGVSLILFIVPAFAAVFSGEKQPRG
jgi:uncharacterized membrane protein YraQ (UPF0718 family)